jgi:ELWxxDGT repeat protein
VAITALTLALVASASGQDGPAYLVRNINQSIDHRAGSSPSGFRAVGPYIYFQADDGDDYGWWRTDRTPGGTQSLRELGLPPPAPERSSEWPFSMHDGALWIADDTGGEARLTAPAPDGGWATIGDLRALDGVALFVGCDDQHGCELWRSDGTATGTGLLIDILPGEESGLDNQHVASIVFDGAMYFVATTPATGAELWRSDGTAAGTQMVRDILPGPGDGIGQALGSSRRLPQFVSARGMLFFIGSDGLSGFELWRTDGSRDGTRLAIDLIPGQRGALSMNSYDCLPEIVATAPPAETLLVAGCRSDTDDTRELWQSDGSAAGTVRLESSAVMPAVIGDTLYYVRRNEDEGGPDQLMRRRLDETQPTPVLPLTWVAALTAVGDGLMLTAGTPETGEEPWWSDGTAAGTFLLRDIRGDDADTDPRNLIALGDLLLFSGDDGVHGRELWRSDASAAGTTLVADIAAGPANSNPSAPTRLADAILFIADDGVHGAEPWRSDGTAAGTWLLADVNPGPAGSRASDFVVAGVRAFFYADDGARGAELWSTDGTAAGTRLALDIAPGALGSSRAPRPYLAGIDFRGALYFAADDGTHGSELWRSDGSAAGTALVIDLAPGAADASPGFFLAQSDRLLFSRASTDTLWQTDGTADGTGPLDSRARLYRFVASGDTWYGSGWDEDSDDEAVWRIDVTGPPQLVAPRTDLDAMFDVGGALFGVSNVGALWRLDREPAAGSRWLSGLWEVDDYAVSGRRLVLYGDSYRELWSTDGTVDGQIFLQALPDAEYRRWPYDDAARELTVAGGTIFFSAAVGDLGRELWALPTSVLPDVCVDDCPWMWTPTPTDTPEPDAPTPTPIPATPTATPACGDRCTVVSLDPVSGAPGETVTLTAHLRAHRDEVAGLDVQFGLVPDVRIPATRRGRPDCRVDEAIAKNASVFHFTPYDCTPERDCTGVRGLILALDNVDPIPDGATLFTCRAEIARSARPGRRELQVGVLGASDPGGGAIAASGEAGALTVLSRGTQAVSDASGGGCQTGAAGGESAWPLLIAALLYRAIPRRRCGDRA